MICLALTAPTLSGNLEALTFYRQWIDIAELRADKLDPIELNGLPAWLDTQHRTFGLSFILTFRLPADGGDWKAGDDARRSAMLRIMSETESGTISRIDLEEHLSWPEVEVAAADKGIGEIRSLHDFSGTPDGLLERLIAIQERFPPTAAGPVVAKAAVLTKSSADLLALVKAAVELGSRDSSAKPFILLGMGPFGSPSRILAPLWGAWLTFTSAALPGHPPAAPGHMDPKTLAEFYGYKTMNRKTAVFAIAGNPVAHSKSPAFHNPKLLPYNARYLPVLVDDIKAFLALGDYLDFRGCSVTIPHKEAALAAASAISESARLIGACNTLVRNKNGWYGTNTDAPGFYQPLKALFPQGGNRGGVSGNDDNIRAAIIGAGGAARGIAVALLENGFNVCIFNRTLERAEILVRELGVSFPGRVLASKLPSREESVEVANQVGPKHDVMVEFARRKCAEFSGLIVQTTSMGMDGELENADPLWFYEFNGSETVYDIVYTPPRTVFLERAEKAGCRVINGERMFEEQALLQSELFVAAAKSNKI